MIHSLMLLGLGWNSDSMSLAFESCSSRPSLTRRDIIRWTAIGLPISIASSAGADNMPLFPGGSALYEPIIEESKDWKPMLQTQLGQARIGATELSPLQQPTFGPQELYYAPFLFGSWNVTATLKRKIFPYGANYLPSSALLEGSPRHRQEKVGDSFSYEIRYFSTLANTISNQLTVNLGTGVPHTKIIQDRAFNAKSISSAYKQMASVQDVEWDYSQNPTKLTLLYGALADDMRPLGPRRTEIFLNARTVEVDDDGVNYGTAERFRLVTLAPASAIVSDIETISEFHKIDEDHVTSVSRIAVYLTPNPNSREGVLWQQVGGKAVALYDYAMDMRRNKEIFQLNDGRIQERACVQTPKDVVQCN